MTPDSDLVEAGLRAVIIEEDYDMHKFLECGEDDGENRYPELVETFILAYTNKQKELRKAAK